MPGLIPGVVKPRISTGFKTARPTQALAPRVPTARVSMPKVSPPRTTVPPAMPKAGKLLSTGAKAPGVPAKGVGALPKPVAAAPKIAVPGIKRASWEGLAKARRRRQPTPAPASGPAALRRRQLRPAVTMDDLMEKSLSPKFPRVTGPGTEGNRSFVENLYLTRRAQAHDAGVAGKVSEGKRKKYQSGQYLKRTNGTKPWRRELP